MDCKIIPPIIAPYGDMFGKGYCKFEIPTRVKTQTEKEIIVQYIE